MIGPLPVESPAGAAYHRESISHTETDARMRILTTLLLTLLLGGCQLLPGLPEEAVYQRGVLTLRQGSFMFRRCGQLHWQPALELAAPLPEEYQRYSGGQQELPLYVEGWMLHDTDGWRVLQPRVIGGGLDACGQTFPGMLLLAEGARPAWSLRLEASRMVLDDPGQRRRLIVHQPDFIRRGQLWQWTGRLTMQGERRDLLFEVERRPCRDGVGNWYALSAHADLDGEAFFGCARYGDLQLLDLAGFYDTGDAYLRRVALVLRGDGRLRLVEDARQRTAVEGPPGALATADGGALVAGAEGKRSHRGGGDPVAASAEGWAPAPGRPPSRLR